MSAAGQGLPQPPPGMSVYAVKRVIGEAQWSAEQLEQVQRQQDAGRAAGDHA